MNDETDTPADDDGSKGRGRSGELRADGVTIGGTPDPDDPAAVAPWPPPGQEHLAEKETKSRDEHDLPSPGVTVGGTPDPDDPAAVAPWHPEDDAEPPADG